MRTPLPMLLLAAVACAGPAARPPASTSNGARSPLAIDREGRTVVIAGEGWRAPGGIRFFEREGALHVVSLVPGNAFDVAVQIGPDGRPQIPADAPFDVKDGTLALRDRAAAPVARLTESGQLYRHDDHFHLTHRYENSDWQSIYRARLDDSPVAPATRQVAAAVLATLLDARVAGGSEEATARSMHRTEKVIALARRAIEAELPAKQIMAMVLHDFEIGDQGRTLSIEGASFRAAGDLRFTYCGDHFHVEEGDSWVHAIPLSDMSPGAFEMPPSMFYEVSDGTVSARTEAAAWRDLLARHQIRLSGDGWFLSERYAHPALARLQRAANDPGLSRASREGARRSVLEFLELRLDIDSDAAFRARLAAIDRDLELRWKELEGQIAAERAGRR